MASIQSSRLIVGLEIHVELSTRSKVFTRAANPAHAAHANAAPNTLIDPLVLGLPGALPVLNKRAVELSLLVGLALGCEIASRCKWDRKSYFYPDLPKAYQISQYDQPLCGPGAVDLPLEDGTFKQIGIIRAHLEEDAGKLLHEAPGGAPIDGSIVDFNRAGAPLLEIVTAPDFSTANEAVAFAKQLRTLCRFLGVTEGVMQQGHMRFEPNINTSLTLEDGREVRTPVVEIKNLNSFRALHGAIEYESAHQPCRFLEDGREMGPGAKSTRGWDDAQSATVLQRTKEDAHDYRYFPDPDLVPLEIDASWLDTVRADLPELPLPRAARYRASYGLSAKEAAALVEERGTCEFYERCTSAAQASGLSAADAGRQSANAVLQTASKLANERGVLPGDLGATPEQVAGILRLRADDAIGSSAASELFGLCCDASASAAELAESNSLLQVRDEGQLAAWAQAVIADPANAKSVADVRGGKTAAVGRLVGGVMKRSGGQADAKAAREKLCSLLSVADG